MTKKETKNIEVNNLSKKEQYDLEKEKKNKKKAQKKSPKKNTNSKKKTTNLGAKIFAILMLILMIL